MSLAIFLVWVGAWLWLSGTVHETAKRGLNSYYQFSKTAGFEIKRIQVEGRTHTDPYLLKTVLNTDKGDPLLAVDLEYAREMVERINWVKTAHVERRLPDTLYVYIQERTPLALWQDGHELKLIDIEGDTITRHDLSGFKDLLLVTGKDAAKHAPALIATLKTTPVIHDMADSAVRQGERRCDLHLKNGIKVKLPAEDIAFALNVLQKEQQVTKLLDKDIETIDLRTSGRLIVKTRTGDARSYTPVSHKI